MENYAGIDVSLELSSVCVVDSQGKILKKAKVASEPDALVEFFETLGFAVNRIGLEAGPLSQWLHAGLQRAGFETVLLETRHVKAALSAMTVKTDRKDARGIAQLIRMGWFRAVHAKSIGAQEIRALLVARKQLLGRLIDVELSIRGILRGFGLKVGPVTRKNFEARIRELVAGQATLERIAIAMLSARSALKAEYGRLHKAVLATVRDDAVCRRLMTVPGVGPLVAITYKSAIDDPHRIVKSKAAGALFGLTPKKYQSGEKDVTGGITLAGDEIVVRCCMRPPTFCYRASRDSQNLSAGGWTSPSGEARSAQKSPASSQNSSAGGWTSPSGEARSAQKSPWHASSQ
ncbi:Mobile element protein CDS [Bradyrhizobium sp.]|nr:Mobile element protein CDS [Bradyrhizobium sp.]